MRQEVGSRKKEVAAGLLALALLAMPVRGQGISLGGDAGAKKQHVVFVSDAVVVKAGVEQVVELRFRVEDGFHVNSHTPKDELLIPTSLKMDSGDAVKVLGTEYPKGTLFKLSVGDGETLDVYQGEFRVRVKVLAKAGAQDWTGTLHYQACDNAACFPPRSLPVKVAVEGK
jgi:hypothetical protein